MMKMILPSCHNHRFQEHGEILFENCPIDFQKILTTKERATSARDLFRHDPFLKKIIIHTLAPIAFELTGKSSLRIACDQWIDTPPEEGYIQDFFCFQGLVLFFVVFIQEGVPLLKAIHPSHLNNKIPPSSYLVAFALKNGQIINNPKDPFNTWTRNLGYVYGDPLLQQFHPLLIRQ